MDESQQTLKRKVRDIIFLSSTPMAKLFDIVLLVAIVLAILVVMLESVEEISMVFGRELVVIEWILTILFTIEYGLRLWTSPKPKVYAKSFYGIVDLISILPTYLSLFVSPGSHFATIRVLRLLRVFRIFKLSKYLGESKVLINALKASRPKIIVFVLAVVTCTVVLGSIMYIIEPAEAGFTSIPRSIYWAIVTLTTVGYGDIAPQTMLGQFVAAIVMILGYGIIAVPTGIVSVELAESAKEDSTKAPLNTEMVCPMCGEDEHIHDAAFCQHCGSDLPGDNKGVW